MGMTGHYKCYYCNTSTYKSEETDERKNRNVLECHMNECNYNPENRKGKCCQLTRIDRYPNVEDQVTFIDLANNPDRISLEEQVLNGKRGRIIEKIKGGKFVVRPNDKRLWSRDVTVSSDHLLFEGRRRLQNHSMVTSDQHGYARRLAALATEEPSAAQSILSALLLLLMVLVYLFSRRFTGSRKFFMLTRSVIRKKPPSIVYT